MTLKSERCLIRKVRFIYSFIFYLVARSLVETSYGTAGWQWIELFSVVVEWSGRDLTCGIIAGFSWSDWEKRWKFFGQSLLSVEARTKYLFSTSRNSNKSPNRCNNFFQFIILTFVYSSICFGRFPSHHRELNDCNGSLWFYFRIVVTFMLRSWSGQPARPRT